jgi:hypothetical protein
MDDIWSPMEKSMVLQKLRYTFIGDQNEMKRKLKSFQEKFNVDELMINSHIYDHQKRLSLIRFSEKLKLLIQSININWQMLIFMSIFAQI